MHINLWPGPEARAWSACLCLLPTDWPVGTRPAQKQRPQCMSMCVFKCMWLHRSTAANSRPFTVAYQCAVRVLSHPRVGGSQSTLWPWAEQCFSTLELCFQRSGQPSLHTHTYAGAFIYCMCTMMCLQWGKYCAERKASNSQFPPSKADVRSVRFQARKWLSPFHAPTPNQAHRKTSATASRQRCRFQIRLQNLNYRYRKYLLSVLLSLL